MKKARALSGLFYDYEMLRLRNSDGKLLWKVNFQMQKMKTLVDLLSDISLPKTDNPHTLQVLWYRMYQYPAYSAEHMKQCVQANQGWR